MVSQARWAEKKMQSALKCAGRLKLPSSPSVLNSRIPMATRRQWMQTSVSSQLDTSLLALLSRGRLLILVQRETEQLLDEHVVAAPQLLLRLLVPPHLAQRSGGAPLATASTFAAILPGAPSTRTRAIRTTASI